MTAPIPARIAVCLLCCGMLPAAGAASEPEDELKAAIVLSFLHYTEWPAPQPGNGSLTVGVLGRQAFAQVLRRSLEGKSVSQRAIRVVEFKTAADPQCCQVIYFAGGRSADIQPLLQGPCGSLALTIGEANEFLDWGGAINLLVIDGRMSFEVSLPALQRSRITISSRLLRFGQIRRSAKRGPP